jgi:hypothetical protein
MHPSELTIEELLEQCDVRRQRRSGPGGQHRNKVETAVVLTHGPSGVRAEASERRSQHENRGVAIARLRVNLALVVRHPRSPDSIPSSRWTSRCHGGLLRVNPEHEDFAPLLAEALDVIEAQQHDVPAAAALLRVTTSQLVRFLKLEPRALEGVNRRRERGGQHRLK